LLLVAKDNTVGDIVSMPKNLTTKTKYREGRCPWVLAKTFDDACLATKGKHSGTERLAALR
jgi:hypothetical protein